MTIYIYGSKSFKNNIHDVLEHANMKFKLSEDDSIQELASLHELREAIEEDPTNIFLIDDEKIIKKGALKFLKPKDGIEEEFLKVHGIGDLSVDNISDIATHIVKKLKKAHAQKEALQESLKKEEPVEKQDEESVTQTNDFEFLNGEKKQDKTLDHLDEDDFLSLYTHDHGYNGLENAHDHDDDHFDIDDVINFGENEDKYEEENDEDDNDDEEEIDFEELDKEENGDFPSSEDSNSNENLHEEDFGLTVEEIEKIEKDEDSDMSDEFSELDSLNEDELLEALSGSNVKNDTITKSPVSAKKSSAEVELNSSSVHDISSLITQLLNNKTLEITIKIKE